MADISEELHRIGARIERLAKRAAQSQDPLDIEIYAFDVQSAIAARRLREDFFPASYFGEPAWEILLLLFAAELEGQTLTISDTCQRTGAPDTTALRWIAKMTEQGALVRRNHPVDRRIAYVSLSPHVAGQMRAYFESAKRRAMSA